MKPMTGDEVRAARQRLGLTQAQFAERLGVARMTVVRWENGWMAVGSTAAVLIRLLANRRGK
jgi:DNA-binding transcriptional regulator YiaG